MIQMWASILNLMDAILRCLSYSIGSDFSLNVCMAHSKTSLLHERHSSVAIFNHNIDY